jgi:general secretion pathway protein E
MAVQAALTGHPVFSTLHTNDAPSAITRLLELGIAPYLINATLLGVLAQRLVRTLCLQCRVPDDLTPVAALARALIRPEPDTDALRLQAGRDGMRPLRLAGAQRVALGQTVLAEVLASTPALV